MVLGALHPITIGACSRHQPLFLPRNAAKWICRYCRSLIFWRLTGIFCIYGETHFQDSTKNLTTYNIHYVRRLHCRVSLMGFHCYPSGIIFRHTWPCRIFVVVRSDGSLCFYCRYHHEAQRLSTIHVKEEETFKDVFETMHDSLFPFLSFIKTSYEESIEWKILLRRTENNGETS